MKAYGPIGFQILDCLQDVQDVQDPPPLHMENSICFWQIIFESFPYVVVYTLFSSIVQYHVQDLLYIIVLYDIDTYS